MPFLRDNLTQIRAQIAADINAGLPGSDALLRYSNLNIIGDALAGQINGLYSYLDWIAMQSVPFTATDEYLEGWAALKKVTRKPATAASGPIAITGADGTVIPAGSAVSRNDGVSYVTTADGEIASGTATVTIQAIDVGAAGNALVGTSFSLAVGISGANASATASDFIIGGNDIEQDYRLRSRMLSAFANPPQGGSINDYGEWALAVPGVTRAWVRPGAMGAGSVVLYFMMDDTQAANGGFPQGSNGVSSYDDRDTAATGDQLTVANVLFLEQPVTPVVYLVAPLVNTVDLTINGLSTAPTATKTALEAAFASALIAAGSPGGVTDVDAIWTAIANVGGTDGFVITGISCSAGSVAPGANGNITSNAGALPVAGNVTYT